MIETASCSFSEKKIFWIKKIEFRTEINPKRIIKVTFKILIILASDWWRLIIFRNKENEDRRLTRMKFDTNILHITFNIEFKECEKYGKKGWNAFSEKVKFKIYQPGMLKIEYILVSFITLNLINRIKTCWTHCEKNTFDFACHQHILCSFNYSQFTQWWCEKFDH